ncbi:hypothetical protein [Kitasatospora sp. NPDC088351]
MIDDRATPAVPAAQDRAAHLVTVGPPGHVTRSAPPAVFTGPTGAGR